MDFSKLGSISFRQELPKDPIKIFEALPSLDGTPNDLWRGQAEALKSWYCSNDKNDVLVSLNTGAGKTIVGLLIAQSLINQGYENVLYVCSTINLVEQTEQEAIKIGIQQQKLNIAFELKTDKESPVNYVKKDISQGHDHIQWCHNNAENLELLGLTYIAHEKGEVDRQANLDNKMCFTTTNQIIQIMDRVLALFDDLIGLTPLQRNTEMIAKSKEAKWKIESIFDELKNN